MSNAREVQTLNLFKPRKILLKRQNFDIVYMLVFATQKLTGLIYKSYYGVGVDVKIYTFIKRTL